MTRFSSASSLAFAVALAISPQVHAQSRGDKTPQPVVSVEMVSEMQVRLLRLEQTVEQLTGQIEELRFKNGQQARQLQQLQDDLSLRVAALEQGAGGQGVPAAGQAMAPVAAAPSAAPSTPRYVSPSAAALGDKPVDMNAPMSAPVSRQPDMAPRPAAPAAGQAPAQAAANAPATTDNGFALRTDAFGKPLPPDPNAKAAPVVQAPAAPAPVPRAAPNPGPVTAAGASSAPVTVVLPQGTPKQQYEYAFDFLKRQDFPRAEVALREFLKKNPKDPAAGNAQYWLGETFYVRGDYQQSAVEFMAGYQNYPKSVKGPDNLLKLGMSMAKLNQTQGACTALGRIAKEYPDASDEIRTSTKAERVKLKCP